MGIPVMASGFRAGSTAQLLTGREPEPSAGGFVGNGNTGGWQLTNLIRASREKGLWVPEESEGGSASSRNNAFRMQGGA